MKHIQLKIIIINILLILICSCSQRAPETNMAEGEEIEVVEDPLYNDREPADDDINPVEIGYDGLEESKDDDISSDPSENPIDELENYSIVLSMDKELLDDETGTLKIWIGSSGIEVSYSDEEVTAEKHISSGIGQYAKITPYAPDFEIDPEEVGCIKIHPSGSEILFSLKPLKTGNLVVSANIELYNNANCTGTAVPKTAETLSVLVEVNRKAILKTKTKELTDVIWDNFLIFFGSIISIIFGVIVYKFRKKAHKIADSDD